MKVEIYSDVVCPWCYIGERRFERALAAFPAAGDVEVVFRPYQLDPSTPETAVPTMQYLERRFGRPVNGMVDQVTAAAAAEGITMDFDRALAVNTRTAHRLLRLAEREYGPAVQRALMDALFDAHFSGGGDVSDHALLTTLAEGAGMDADRVRGYLASGEGAAALATEFAEARALGIKAVPTFVLDGQYMVEGGQPASTFLQVLEEVQRRATAERVGSAGTSDDASCADGVCAV